MEDVLSSPMLAGLAVTLAEPSGLWGMLKESMASARAMRASSSISALPSKGEREGRERETRRHITWRR